MGHLWPQLLFLHPNHHRGHSARDARVMVLVPDSTPTRRMLADVDQITIDFDSLTLQRHSCHKVMLLKSNA